MTTRTYAYRENTTRSSCLTLTRSAIKTTEVSATQIIFLWTYRQKFDATYEPHGNTTRLNLSISVSVERENGTQSLEYGDDRLVVL